MDKIIWKVLLVCVCVCIIIFYINVGQLSSFLSHSPAPKYIKVNPGVLPIDQSTAYYGEIDQTTREDETRLLFPSLQYYDDDRIIAQMKQRNCSVRSCQLTSDQSLASSADAIFFLHTPSTVRAFRPKNQIWILFTLESPYHTPDWGAFNDLINWTATYRHDSVLVGPYNKFVPFDQPELQNPNKQDVINYAHGKLKKVAWFISNCNDRNGRRLYANELGKYINIDIYGSCGTLHCGDENTQECYDMLRRDYKFYLAFENSNCRDYITEKLFRNALKHDIIPVVMGAPRQDYKRVAPPGSYIHVDDFESPKALAEYLHKLDQNDDLYNNYFKWKGSGWFLETGDFYCRMCSMLYEVETHPSIHYHDLNKWWRGSDVCIGRNSWRSLENITEIISVDH
ncbi:hypothetical protein ScPMuIL_007666 [Solemya velum]